jgi:hypothetical protein
MPRVLNFHPASAIVFGTRQAPHAALRGGVGQSCVRHAIWLTADPRALMLTLPLPSHALAPALRCCRRRARWGCRPRRATDV